MNKSVSSSPLAPKDLARVVRSTKCLCDKLQRKLVINQSFSAIRKAKVLERINKLIEDNHLIHFV